MAVRGVYTEAEQKMLDETNKKMDTMVGWMEVSNRVITEETMINYAYDADPENPLWRDNNYAQNTRWGSIIAFPSTFQEVLGSHMFKLEATPECGYNYMILIGDDWEFFRPVHAGDSFKVWSRRPVLKDVTSLDGKGPRKLTCLVNDLDQINQRDELCSKFKQYTQHMYFTEPLSKPESTGDISEYRYTKEELAFLDRIEDEEEIRGANIRYWEDVSIGEDTKPVILGPITILDMVGCTPRRDYEDAHSRRAYQRMPLSFIQDPVTGVHHHYIEAHLSDKVAALVGNGRAFIYARMARYLMVRLVTNWMGDDGFLRRFNWRALRRSTTSDAIVGVSHPYIGESLICKGKVTNKRVENGDHLVDLRLCLSDMRGITIGGAVATASLFSREAPYPWK